MWKTPLTLRRLLDPKSNINVWEKDENGVYVPVETSTGFTLFSTSPAYPLFFDGSYKMGTVIIQPTIEGAPALDSGYRSALNQKIIDHYIDYRIGYPSPNLFYVKFNSKLNEIMNTYNARYRLAWEYFAEKLPYGYYEKETINGGTKSSYNSDVTNEHGERKNYDWSGFMSGNDSANPSTSKNYNFDTPQNLSSLNPSSPDHMSSATVSENHDGSTYSMNGYVNLTSGNASILRDTDHPTQKSTAGDDTTKNRGYDNVDYVNRFNEKYGYRSEDRRALYELSAELANIDLEIIKALRDQFLYIYD